MPVVVAVDANVLLKAYIPEALSDNAASLLHKIEIKELSPVAPDFIYSELGNVLWKKYKLKELNKHEILRIAEQFMLFPLYTIASKSIFQLALDISILHEISVYDAIYVGVAKIYETRLVTADKKLVDKLAKTTLGHSVQWLGDKEFTRGH